MEMNIILKLILNKEGGGIYTVQDSNKWRSFLNTVISFRGYTTGGRFIDQLSKNYSPRREYYIQAIIWRAMSKGCVCLCKSM